MMSCDPQHHATNRAAPCDSKSEAVGVVIPVYNRRTTMLGALRSVVSQTAPPAKLVVVDDGSEDDSAAAASDWLADQAPGLAWSVERRPHQSAAAARNHGLRLVRELPFVAFLDSDDRWPADFLERTVAAMQARPDAAAVSAPRRLVDPAGKTLRYAELSDMAVNPIPWFFAHGAGVASCTLLRTEVVDRVGGWREELATCEDTFLFAGVALAGTWLLAPGEAVCFSRGLAAAQKESGNLSSARSNRLLRQMWAVDHERLYDEIGILAPSFDRSQLREAMAYRWSSAAKDLAAQGLREEARAAVQRALWWSPLSLRAWRQRLRLALRRRAA